MPLKVRFVDDDEVEVLVTPNSRRVRGTKDHSQAVENGESVAATRTPRRAALKAQVLLRSSQGSEAPSRKRRDSADSRDSDDVIVREEEEDFEEVEKDSVAPYTSGEGLVSGEQVYNFNTPRRTSRHASRLPTPLPDPGTPTSGRRSAIDSGTPKTKKAEECSTPKSKKSQDHGTPKTKRESALRTPSSGRRRIATEAAETATPDRKGKQRLKQKIQKITEEMLDFEDLSSSGSEFEPSESESSEVSEEESQETIQSFKNIAASKPFVRTPGRPRKNRPVIDPNVDAESYFKSQSEDNLTSNRTLARLREPRLEKSQVDSILRNVKDGHAVERNELLDEHRSLFPKWLFLLGEGYNLLLYGFGSKSSLIEEFHQSMLPNEDVIVVNGFFPSLTLKEILNSISQDLLEIEASFHSNEDHLKAIEERLKSWNKCVYVLVNNIEGHALQNEKTQLLLSSLAAVNGIKLVATVDHMNAPLMWDHSKLSRFKFLWFDVTTFLPYTNETAFESSLMVQNSSELALSSLAHVFASLTPNAKKIFCLLANFQLENDDVDAYKGLAFPELYRMCREAFLVNSDVTLRAQLTEFRDHKLLKSKRSAEGVELITIPLDSGTIVEFLAQQEDSAV